MDAGKHQLLFPYGSRRREAFWENRRVNGEVVEFSPHRRQKVRVDSVNALFISSTQTLSQ